MKTSKVLKITTDWLSPFPYEYDGKEKFICIAMRNACDAGKIPWRDYERCQLEISHRLEGAYTLECWLKAQGHLPENFLLNSELMQRVQDYRHAWLYSMIAEFKSKGD